MATKPKPAKAPVAYRVFSPHGTLTHADGLASHGPGQTPPTWFIAGEAYVEAGHPRAHYYLTSGAYRSEPVDDIPQAYKAESARLTRQPQQALAPPTVDYGRSDPTRPLPR